MYTCVEETEDITNSTVKYRAANNYSPLSRFMMTYIVGKIEVIYYLAVVGRLKISS
jgi:hypothetical protein